MRKTCPLPLMPVASQRTTPAGTACPAKETKEDHAIDRNSSCVYKESEGAMDLSAPLFVCTAYFFIFFSPAFLCRCGEQPTSAVFSGSGI